MTEEPAEEASRCDHCGAAVALDAWFGLEVQRPYPDPRARNGRAVEHDYVIFCRQEHAAEWLATVQLPVPVPQSPDQDRAARSWGVLAADLTWVVVPAVVALFAVVGLATTVWGVTALLW